MYCSNSNVVPTPPYHLKSEGASTLQAIREGTKENEEGNKSHNNHNFKSFGNEWWKAVFVSDLFGLMKVNKRFHAVKNVDKIMESREDEGCKNEHGAKFCTEYDTTMPDFQMLVVQTSLFMKRYRCNVNQQ